MSHTNQAPPSAPTPLDLLGSRTRPQDSAWVPDQLPRGRCPQRSPGRSAQMPPASSSCSHMGASSFSEAGGATLPPRTQRPQPAVAGRLVGSGRTVGAWPWS